MINERAEVQQYLQGKNLHRDIEYRICLLLAKWFYEQGYKTEPEIREQLKKWAKENNFYFEVAMNPIATRVIEKDMKFLGGEDIYINTLDIELIKNNFDSYYEQITALGVLCYAKAYADEKGEFKLSQRSFSHWVGINKKTVTKYLKLLEKFKYIEKVESGAIKSWYQTTVIVQLNTYKILVPHENCGEYELKDNDIELLYSELFTDINLENEQWYDVPGYFGYYQVSSEQRVRVCRRVVNGREFPEKILNQFKSKSGKAYVNLLGEDGKQKKISVEKLLEMAS